MARGDYVRTYAGAIAQGALSVIRGVFGAGGSIARASELLQERFPSLPQPIANVLAINTFRTAQQRRLEQQTRQVLRPAAPQFEPTTGLARSYRIQVEAIAVQPDGEWVAFSSHYFDTNHVPSQEETADMMSGWLGPLFGQQRGDYPQMFEPTEEATDIEYRITRVQERVGV